MSHCIYAAIFSNSSIFFTARENDNPPEDSQSSLEWAKDEERRGNGRRFLVAATLEHKGISNNVQIASNLSKEESEQVRYQLVHHFRKSLPKGSVLNMKVSNNKCQVSNLTVDNAIEITKKNM